MAMASSRAVPRQMQPWHRRFSWLLLVLVLSATPGRSLCGVEFLFPTPNMTFHYLDIINVTYQSNFSHPALYTWCGANPTVQKFVEPSAPAFNASYLVRLSFNSSVDCWFDLKPGTSDCGDNSPVFRISSVGSQSTIGLEQVSPSAASGGASAPSNATGTGTLGEGSGGLSTAAQVGLGIGLAIVVGVCAGGLAVYFWLRRRQPYQQQAGTTGGLFGRIFRRRREEKPRPLLSGGSERRGPRFNSGISRPWRKPRRIYDDAYYVGFSEHLPGFYGSASDSGSKQVVSQPLTAYHGAAGGSVLATTYEEAHHANQVSGTNTPEQNAAETFQSLDRHGSGVELPGKDSYRGYGQEFELSTQQQPSMFHPAGREAQEQKFLLQDMELLGLKKKNTQRRL